MTGIVLNQVVRVVVSESNITGGWRTTFTIPGFVGAPFVESTIRAVTKTG